MGKWGVFGKERYSGSGEGDLPFSIDRQIAHESQIVCCAVRSGYMPKYTGVNKEAFLMKFSLQFFQARMS